MLGIDVCRDVVDCTWNVAGASIKCLQYGGIPVPLHYQMMIVRCLLLASLSLLTLYGSSRNAGIRENPFGRDLKLGPARDDSWSRDGDMADWYCQLYSINDTQRDVMSQTLQHPYANPRKAGNPNYIIFIIQGNAVVVKNVVLCV